MKKKKLFLSLAIASAALFSLAACNNTGNAGASTSVPSATPSASSQSTPEASSSAPAASSSNAEASEYSVVIKAKYSDKTTTDTLDTVTVAAGTKINRPNDTVKEGYVFVDYYTNSALTTKFDFGNTAITKATTIYAYYDNQTKYNEFKTDAAENGISAFDIDETFNSITSLTKATDFSTTPRLVDASEGSAAVNISGLKAELVSDGTNKGRLTVDFGGSQTTSTIYGYFELELGQLQKDMFFEVFANGTKSDGTATSKYKLLRIGIEKTGALRAKKDNDANEISLTNPFKFAAEKKYSVAYKIDTTAKKFELGVDDTIIFEYDYSNDSVTGINAVSITNVKPADGDKVYVDNMLCKVAAFDLTSAVANAQTELQDQYDESATLDQGTTFTDEQFATIYAPVKTSLDEGKALIATATDAATLLTKLGTAQTNLETAVNTLRASIKSQAKDAIADKTLSASDIAAAIAFGETDPEAQLAALKTKYTALLDATDYAICGVQELFEDFDERADDIAREKIIMTLNFYEYGYKAQTGLTGFASGVTYYTEAEGVYTKVGASAEFDAAKTYYTYEPLPVKDASNNPVTESFRMVKGDNMRKYEVAPSDGYRALVDIFINDTFTTQLATQTFDADSNLYVIETNTIKWNCRDLAVDADDADAAIAADSIIVYGYVVTKGSVVSKLNSDKDSCIGYEIGKNKTGSFVITLTEAAKVTFVVGSTSSSNTTTKVELIKSGATAATAVTTFEANGTDSTNDNGVMSIIGTDGVTVVYELAAGTYEFQTEDTSRGVRVQQVIVSFE